MLALPARGQVLARKGWAGSGISIDAWWDHAIFYELDPLTFQDSDGDGYGDLRGVTARLDYLEALGVDAIVLSPLPLKSSAGSGLAPTFDPAYGNEEDFDQLIGEASRRKMRVLVDLPADTPEQPFGLARYWLSRGVAGLRLVHQPGLTQPMPAGAVAERTRELRRIAAGYAGARILLDDLSSIGTGSGVAEPTLPQAFSVAHFRHGRMPAPTYARAPRKEPVGASQLAVLRPLRGFRGVSAGILGGALLGVAERPQAVLATDSADQARSLDRLGDGVHDEAIAKEVAAALLLSRPGALLYFGQEIGMGQGSSVGKAPLRAADPAPMQWGSSATESKIGGFTSGTPWVAPGPNAATANVGVEEADRESVLNWYRQMSVLHHGNAAVRNGSMQMLLTGNPDLVAWLRKPAGEASAPVLVVLNVSAHAIVAALGGELARSGVRGTVMRTLARSDGRAAEGMSTVNGIALAPYAVFVGEIRSSSGLEAIALPRRHRRYH